MINKLVLSVVATLLTTTSIVTATEKENPPQQAQISDEEYKLLAIQFVNELMKTNPSVTIRSKNIARILNNSLHLVKNGIVEIPESIGDLVNLTVLDISQNMNLTILPDSIGDLENLNSLSLNDNNLRSLPDSIGNLVNLTVLDISGNRRIKSLPESIGNLKKLNSLIVKDTRLEFISDKDHWNQEDIQRYLHNKK